MSERIAGLGGGLPHVIEYEGHKYVIRPVLTEGTMLAVEQTLYRRGLAALKEQREMMSAEAYAEELRKLRGASQNGDFAFENPEVAAFLQTPKGAFVLLSSLMDCTSDVLVKLMLHRKAELMEALSEIVRISMPEGQPGKAVVAG